MAGYRFRSARVLGLLALCLFAGCDALLSDKKETVPPPAAGETISIASFNIQVFGTSKAGDRKVVDILAKVIRRFDVVAIQEIRSKDQSLMDDFIKQVNADGGHYRFLLGPRLGRTTSKEQYAFIYNAATIEVIEGSVYTVNDRGDRLHREPFVARFRVRGPPVEEAFTFTLINIHTDPDETKTELAALADVFQAVQENGSGEDDVILLGDLNEPPRKYGKLGRLANIKWAIDGLPTNTRETESYDNLLFDGKRTAEFTGQSGVLNLKTEFGLTEKQALAVSDHMPVWGRFTTREQTSARVANGNSQQPMRQ